MKKIYFILFFVIFCIAVTLRLYRINNAVADWHSWRQADTAAVARNFLKSGFDLLRPRFDDLSNVASGLDNPQGWRMAEFPLYQAIGAGLTHFIPRFSVEVWLRLVTISVSVLTGLLLGLIVADMIDPFTGLITSFLYAVLPYSIYYGRTILPDPFMVFWAVASLYCLLKAFGRKEIRWTYVVLAGISAGISLLSKPMGIFLFLPGAYVFLRAMRPRWSWVSAALAYGVMSAVPLLLWRKWILQFPQGIPASSWLFNAGNIRFKGAWFYWLFSQRLGDLILGQWLLIPLGIGLVLAVTKKEGWFFRWWLIGTLLYWIVFAAGNVQHDYYQILVLPIVCVYLAKGVAFLLQNSFINRPAGIVMALTSTIFGLAFSWYTVRTYYWVNHPEIVEAGQAADRLLPKDAKVIAPYGGDTAFLYQTNRQGWPIGFDIPDKIKKGASYYVTVSPKGDDPEVHWLLTSYQVLVRNDKFAIIDLTKPL